MGERLCDVICAHKQVAASCKRTAILELVAGASEPEEWFNGVRYLSP